MGNNRYTSADPVGSLAINHSQKGTQMVRTHRVRYTRVLPLFFILMLVLAACGGTGDDQSSTEGEATLVGDDPVGLLTSAAMNIRAAETFRLDVQQTGADYEVLITLNNEVTAVKFRRAVAQYVNPDTVEGTVRVIAGIVPIDVDIFSNGFAQWVRFIGTSWILEDFAPGFNAETLIAQDTGFQAALAALTDLDNQGETSLDDGTGVYHLSGIADGDAVTSLLVGMIEAEGMIPVDVYIDRDSLYPSRIVIHQVDNATEEHPEGTTWTIDVYDIDAPPELDPPENYEQTAEEINAQMMLEMTAEAMPEVTPEATGEAGE
ncbi:MAG: LppX_LprAFG lipoprotein [Aggregatilineales bacterium]